MANLILLHESSPMNCKTCGTEAKEIATKTTGRGPNGVDRCHRLECGHAWHVTTRPAGESSPNDGAPPTPCGCREIVTVNDILLAGRRLALIGDDVGDPAFQEWSKRVFDALEGIPAESGAPSLARSAATAAKSATSRTTKRIADLNALLVRAIAAVS